MALVFLAAMVCVSAQAADKPQPNLVVNPSFEKAAEGSPLPADWSGDREVYSRDATGGRNGSAALKYVNHDPARYRLAGQQTPLQPGRSYRISGWVKTEDVAGEDSGATFCVEWTDQKGKWLGGSYPHGVKGTADWRQVHGQFRVPDEAGRCTVSCYVRKGMTGTAWFDDVEVVRVIEPPLRSVLTSPVYRGRITAAGPDRVQAVATLDLGDLEAPPAELRVRATLSATDEGKVYGQDEQQPRVEDHKVAPITFAFPCRDLPQGSYRLDVTLVDGSGKTIQTIRHDLSRVADDFHPRCTIDEHRRLLVDGKPFFPLGMYWSGITEDDLKTYSDSKFNCLMPYGAPDRRKMDLAEKYGLKVIYSVKDWYLGSRWCPSSIKTPEQEEAAVRGRVREFRDHAALLAWYLNDELPQSFMPQLEAHQRWVAEEDPQHPTWVVLYQVNEVAAYINTFDVIGTDPYPIGRKPASMAAEWTAETFRQVDRARPVWQVPQLHNWANYAKTDADRSRGRTPSYDEVRSMAWQCIAEGATGLVFYSWYDMKRNSDVPFDQQWAGLKRLAVEIDRMAPVILSVKPTPTVTIDGGRPPKWLHTLVRRREDKLYVMAVNDGDGQGSVTFALPTAVGTVRELSEDRTVEARGQSFDDQLASLAVHLYQIELSQ